MKAWLRAWWLTLRYASPLTKDGRDLRMRVNGNGDVEWVIVDRPS